VRSGGLEDGHFSVLGVPLPQRHDAQLTAYRRLNTPISPNDNTTVRRSGSEGKRTQRKDDIHLIAVATNVSNQPRRVDAHTWLI